MANLQDIKNLVECGAGASLGTGTRGCRPFFSKAVSAWLLPQGTLLDDDEELNLAYVQQLQAEGKLIVLNGIRNFTDNTPDDVTEELEDGTLTYIRGGKYQLSMDFINGMYFHKALHSLSSFGAYDVIFVDRVGSILGTKDNATGQLKGFTVGMMQGNKLTWGTDTTAQREGIMMQLLNRLELDRNYVFIDNKSLGDFDATSVEGVNQVDLSFTAAPADSGTSVTVKAVRAQDGEPVTGLAFGDFLMTVDGVTSNPTADDSEATGAGIYVLTVPALATNEDIVLRLYDNSNNRAVISLASVLYKSNELAATVV